MRNLQDGTPFVPMGRDLSQLTPEQATVYWEAFLQARLNHIKDNTLSSLIQFIDASNLMKIAVERVVCRENLTPIL